MKTYENAFDRRTFLFLSSASLALLGLMPITPALAGSASEIDEDVTAAIKRLKKNESGTKTLAAKAKAVLVFPSIVKAGLMIGGQTGDGALRNHSGKTTGYYNISAVSFGLQAGAQTFGYALFFMNTKALAYLDKSDGWSIGSGPSVVMLDEGMAKSITSTMLTEDVYAFAFGQKGLMAGIGIEGSKITRIHPKA